MVQGALLSVASDAVTIKAAKLSCAPLHVLQEILALLLLIILLLLLHHLLLGLLCIGADVGVLVRGIVIGELLPWQRNVGLHCKQEC